MDGLTPAMPKESATPGVSIPLDLVSPLQPYREQGGLSIRVERLPFKARLSKGRNNGDNTWSLTLDDLNDLLYLPPAGLDVPHTLTVRAISVDNDSASTLLRFDVPIGSCELPATETPDSAATQPTTAEAGAATPPQPGMPPLAGIAEEADRRNEESIAAATAYAFDAAESLVAPAPAPVSLSPTVNGSAAAEQTFGAASFAQELDRRLAEARTSWEAEQQGRVAAAVQEAVQKAQADARAQLDHTTEVRLAMELERRLADARTSWEAELQGRIAIAVEDATRKAGSDVRLHNDQTIEARIAQEVEQRLAAARTTWETEHQGQVAAAVLEAVRKTETDARVQIEQTNEVRVAQEVERRLAEARVSWEAELQGRIAVAVERAVQEAKSAAGAHHDQANEIRLAQEVERRLAEARVSWETELQGRVAVAVQDAARKTEADVRAQLDQTNAIYVNQQVDRRLGEARAIWEAEMPGRVAAAAQEAVLRSETDSRTRLEQAQQEWRIASARELAEMTARYSQAEAALAELRTQAHSGHNAEATAGQLREELASTQALIRARESELAEARHTIERARAEIATRDREAAASVERNRAAWNTEREKLLAQAEENAQERVKHALERWQHETAAALTKAQHDWTEAEETRLAVAEAQWRENIGIAKSRAPITKITRQRRRVQISGRVKRLALIAACLAATAIFYPRLQPIAVEQVWPKIVKYSEEIEPTLHKFTADIKAWVADAVARSKAPATGKKPQAPRRAQ